LVSDKSQLSEMIPLVYAELRRVAARSMRRERAGHTLQPTALVNEAYLRLRKDHGQRWQNRTHFLAIAALSMRQILVERARARGAAKRGGGGQVRVTLADIPAPTADESPDLLALDEALTALERIDPGKARIVELRYFGGLTVEETADLVGVSPATVKRSWTMARAWLKRELSAPAGAKSSEPRASRR
jgi:RNA polymerase sigma factor (TIGR02999 family)